MQLPTISEQQRKALEVCAKKICGGFESLPPYAIIARIMNIEGKNCDQAVKGYQLMRSIGIIPESFVKGGAEVENKLIKTFFHPVFCDMVTRFGLEIEKWDMKLRPAKPGDQPLRLESASKEELDQYFYDYKKHNGVSFGNDTKDRMITRDSIKGLGLSLDDDEPQQAADNQAANIAINFGNKMRQKDHIEVTRKITDTILGLDTDF